MPDLSRPLAAVENRLDELRQKLVEKLGRPDPVRILPYRGFGTPERLWIRGRVLEEQGITGSSESEDVLERLVDMLRRYESDEIAGARLEARLAGRAFALETDSEGFFELEIDDPDRFDATSPWTEVDLHLQSPLQEGQDNPPVSGWIRVPAASARRLVISDMDDTVVRTGATDLFRHARTVLLNNAGSREPFPGVSAFYRALEAGPGGDEGNPVAYVSSSPWNLYDLFESFLDLHEIPLGPILLKDFGLEPGKILKSGHVEYKAERIRRILDTWPDLPAILIGDSGQKDAWVFQEVAESHGDRLLAGYLRDLDPGDPDPRIEEIERELGERGVPLRRFPDTRAAAEHACERGWISETQLAEVKEEAG